MTRPPPFFERLERTLHISHRGGAALAPENTLAAFNAAVHEYATDMLELDVHRTGDGVLVVAHDPTVERCTDGRGPLREMKLSEVQRLDAGHQFTRDGGRTFPFREMGLRIPTLEEVLTTFPSTLMNIEVKPDEPDIEHTLAALLARTDATRRVCIGSELDEVALRLARALPQACHFLPRGMLTEFVLTAKSGETPTVPGPYWVVDMPLWYEGVRLIDAAFLEVASRTGRWINVWTVDDLKEMEQLRDEGVGGIMTDRPDLLRRVLGPRR